MNMWKWIGWISAAALVVLTAGCHNDNAANPVPELHGEVFPNNSDVNAVREINLAQASAGARQDATLHAVHFDQLGLNSLGRQKLDLMLRDETPSEPLVVYLDLPADADVSKDRRAVVTYLKERGLPEAQVALKDGPNPALNSSAADAVEDLKAMQGGAQGPQSGTPGTSMPVPQNATSAGNPQPAFTSH